MTLERPEPPHPPDPETDTLQTLRADGMRRLVRIRYSCPLCRRGHTTEQYITVPAATLEDYSLKILKALADPGFTGHIVSAHMTLLHEEQGDLHRYQQRISSRTLRTRIIAHKILEESDYTCPECQQTFPTIADCRRHQGVDPRTGRPVPPRFGIAACKPGI